MSAFGNAEQLVRANLAASSDFLKKPFQEFELREVVAVAVKKTETGPPGSCPS
jgi:FixJ family two-component response regulator